MKIQWDKVPERLHSESLKCLFCTAMARTLRKTDDYKHSVTLCCSLMVFALTMDDDEAFESEEKLVQALSCRKYLHDPMSEEDITFVTQHAEYFLECTSRVLKAVKACPDKPYNRRRNG